MRLLCRGRWVVSWFHCPVFLCGVFVDVGVGAVASVESGETEPVAIGMGFAWPRCAVGFCVLDFTASAGVWGRVLRCRMPERGCGSVAPKYSRPRVDRQTLALPTLARLLVALAAGTLCVCRYLRVCHWLLSFLLLPLSGAGWMPTSPTREGKCTGSAPVPRLRCFGSHRAGFELGRYCTRGRWRHVSGLMDCMDAECWGTS